MMKILITANEKEEECKVLNENNECRCPNCNEMIPLWYDICPCCKKKLNWENFYFN